MLHNPRVTNTSRKQIKQKELKYAKQTEIKWNFTPKTTTTTKKTDNIGVECNTKKNSF